MSTHNRRNSQNRRSYTPSPPSNQRQRPEIVFEPKLKYANSSHTHDGMLIVSKRKRSPPTPEKIEETKRKKMQIKVKQVALSTLRHRIIGIWEHGINTQDFQFGPHNNSQIISFLQVTNPKYTKRAAAASFVYRTIKKHRSADETPHLDPFRDRRGENRKSPKRKNAEIIEICDEMLSEPKATAPKVRREIFLRLGVKVSDSTIYRIESYQTCFTTGPNPGARIF